MAGNAKEMLPLIDLGNHPVVFATRVARVDRMQNGLVGITLVEDRIGHEGTMEAVVVLRVIRPVDSVVVTHEIFAQELGRTAAAGIAITEDSPVGMQ